MDETPKKIWILKSVTVSVSDGEWLDKQARGVFTNLVRNAIKTKREQEIANQNIALAEKAVGVS